MGWHKMRVLLLGLFFMMKPLLYLS
ncbi:twitching motility protein PilT, partial [Vibrio tasmaniensis]